MIRAKQAAALTLVALLVLSTLVAFSSPVRAQEEEEEEEEGVKEVEAPEEEEEEVEREVGIEIGKKEVKIESTLSKEGVPGEIENKFEVEFSVDEEVEIELKYAEEVETENMEREMELVFEVEFESLIEFVDNDGDGLYDGGEDVFVYELEDREFTLISYTTENVDQVIVQKITTQTADGILEVMLHVAGEFVIIGGDAVKPTEVKIDIGIHTFPYTHDNSKLALECKIKSVMETEEEKKVGDVEEEIKITSGDYHGFFSWKAAATVDGIEKPVLSTELMEGGEEKKLYLIYEHGDSIVHDPKIGVRGAVAGVAEAIGAINWMTVIIAAMVAALVSIGVTLLMLRRKGY